MNPVVLIIETAMSTSRVAFLAATPPKVEQESRGTLSQASIGSEDRQGRCRRSSRSVTVAANRRLLRARGGGLWWSVGSEGIRTSPRAMTVHANKVVQDQAQVRFVKRIPGRVTAQLASAGTRMRCRKGGCSFVVSDDGRIAERLKRGTCSWGVGGGEGG